MLQRGAGERERESQFLTSGKELQKLVRLALQKHETLRVRIFGEPLELFNKCVELFGGQYVKLCGLATGN